MLNVLFCFPFSWQYYLRHPWEWLSQLWHNLKNSWCRATKGFAPIDVWNMSDWMLEVLPVMFRYLSKGNGCPSAGEFDTLEKWHDHLNAMADVLESLQEENWESRNEFNDDFEKAMDRSRDIHGHTVTWNTDAEADEIIDLWKMRAQELWEERQKLVEDTFSVIAKNFFTYWD